MYVGIDVSAARGLDVCVLDERKRVAVLAVARDLDALETVARGLPRTATVAVDAPPQPSKDLVPGKNYRVAERDLHALGVSLYPVPRSARRAKEWMRTGFALYRLLGQLGFPTFLHGDAGRGVAIEVYPHLSYLALAGRRRGATPKREWARAALRGRVGGLPAGATQDQLDAACAALTAWYFVAGKWIGFGDPSEGVIIAPRTGHDLGGGRAPGQLRLPLEGDGGARAGPRVLGPARPSTFAERVLRTVGRIPPGKVATYGDVARWAGNPAGARAVGTILTRHAFEVPCHRVVDAHGAPPPYPEDAARTLRREGVAFEGDRVRLSEARWRGPS